MNEGMQRLDARCCPCQITTCIAREEHKQVCWVEPYWLWLTCGRCSQSTEICNVSPSIDWSLANKSVKGTQICCICLGLEFDIWFLLINALSAEVEISCLAFFLSEVSGHCCWRRATKPIVWVQVPVSSLNGLPESVCTLHSEISMIAFQQQQFCRTIYSGVLCSELLASK